MNSSDELKAIKHLKKGKHEGFRVIFALYHERLFMIAKKYLKDTQLAEDAVQEIFIKIWIKRETLDPEKSLKAFLITCLQNHIRNVVRNRKRKILGSFELKETNHPCGHSTSDEIQENEYHLILNNGIDGMPAKRKEIYRLKIHEGLSNEEVAEKLEISVNTVKAHYFQGNKYMKSYLKKKADIVVNT